MANRWLPNIESKTKPNEVENDDLELQEEDMWLGFMEKSEDPKEPVKKLPKPVSFSWPPSKSLSAWGSEASATPKMDLQGLKSWEKKSKKCGVEQPLAGVKIPEKTKKCVADDVGGDEMIPPHEILAMRTASRRMTVVAYSMVEGIGRTLKGRDQCNFRNAVFLRTGYLD